MNPIAIKIKEARIKAGMSEKDLAKKCGLAPTYIIHIESGKKIINEKTAESILAVFGEKIEFIFQEELNEPEVIEKKVEKKQEAPSFYDVEPNEQWAGALANIIKKYPVYEMGTQKIVGHKELPILSKKVEGLPWDKLIFIKVIDQDLESLRICKGDIVMIHEMKEIQSRGIYFIEIDQKKMLRLVHKDSANKLIIGRSSNDPQSVSVELSKVKVIGKCTRVSFDL